MQILILPGFTIIENKNESVAALILYECASVGNNICIDMPIELANPVIHLLTHDDTAFVHDDASW